MEEVSFDIVMSEAAKAAKEALVRRLHKEPRVLAFLRDHQLDEAFIDTHSGMLKQWLDTLDHCGRCQGLAFCVHEPRGHYLDLTYDGILAYGLRACAHYNDERARLSHQRHYAVMDFAKQDLRIDLTTLDVSKESAEYKEVYSALIAHLLQEKKERGFYLAGPPGVGKSYLCIGICNYFARKGLRVAFVNVPHLISSLKLLFSDSEAMEEKLTRISDADVAVFDDIGGESMTAWSRDEVLLTLLDARMNHHRLTYFTSNYTMDELQARFALANGRHKEAVAALRVLERVKALSVEKKLKGRSRR